jgi:hypothetical protein
LADGVRVSLSCEASGEVLPIPLARIPELEKAAIAIGHLGKLWRVEECTLCCASGQRGFRIWPE